MQVKGGDDDSYMMSEINVTPLAEVMVMAQATGVPKLSFVTVANRCSV